MSYSELLAKAEYKGKGKRVGTPGNYRYIYPSSGSKKSKKPKEEKPKKKGLMSKIFGGLKKLWKRGDKPSDNAKAALEGMAQDEKVVEAVRDSKDKEGLQHLEEMLKAHGAEIKELKAELRNRNSGQQQQQQQPKKKSLLALLLEAVRAALSKLGGTDKKAEESKDEEKTEAEESKDEEKTEDSKDDKKAKKVEKGFTMGYSELLSKSLETFNKGGPYIGPRGGKWADPQHKIPYDEKKHKGKAEPKEKDFDEHQADQLQMYMENTEEYVNEDRQNGTKSAKGYAIQNLVQKMAAGKYDHAQAGKLVGYMVDAAAKQYRKDFGSGSFDPATRKEVARRIADEIHDLAQEGEYDDHHSVSSGVHKKRAAAGGGISKIAQSHGKKAKK